MYAKPRFPGVRIAGVEDDGGEVDVVEDVIVDRSPNDVVRPDTKLEIDATDTAVPLLDVLGAEVVMTAVGVLCEDELVCGEGGVGAAIGLDVIRVLLEEGWGVDADVEEDDTSPVVMARDAERD